MPVLSRSLATMAVHAAGGDPRSDSELLARFSTDRDESAFSALVLRHGSLVYGVCRRTLGASADADDCFQATFLVLVQKAKTIPWRSNLGPWLFGVAHRVAQKARFKRNRRFAVEKQVEAMPHPETTPANAIDSDELSRNFDEELAALPEEMRRAVILCELQGRSRSQAAKELRISEGTLSSRLARARKTLRDRLAKRGLVLAIPLAMTVSARLMAATVGLVNGSAGVVPVAVWTLTQEALKTMAISKLKLGAVLAALAIGFTGFGLSVSAEDDKKPQVEADPQVKPVTATEKAKPGPVASIHGQDISREEFAEYLIRKYGAKEIEGFVGQKIIEVEAMKKGVKVTAEEVDAELKKDAEAISIKAESFVKEILPKYGKSEADWRDNVLLPRLLMGKLYQGDTVAREDDLKKLFERKYGAKRKVKCIYWPKDSDEKLVKEQYERIKKHSLAFDELSTRFNRPGQAKELTMTFGEAERSYAVEPVLNAIYALKEIGEVSELVATDYGYSAVKLVEIIPVANSKKFEDEKAALKAAFLFEANRDRLQSVIAQQFAKLKEQAKPIYHIQPEPKSQLQPTQPPAKK